MIIYIGIILFIIGSLIAKFILKIPIFEKITY